MSSSNAAYVANSRKKPDATFESIQALRGVAAILVTLFHAASHFDKSEATFRVGNAGVDIFFVISGFVMWSAVARRSMTPETFLRHRFIRLVPLYAIFTLALLGGWVLAPSAFPHMRPPTAEHVLLSLAFIPHVDPDGRIFPLLAQGWTLNFEMFFYLLFALALMAPRRGRLMLLAASLLALPLLGLGVSPAQIHAAPPLGLLSPLLVEFLGGVLVAQALRNGWRPGAVLCWASIAAGALALAVPPNPAAADDAARLLLFGGPALLIVAGAVGLEAGSEKFSVGRAPMLLGAASYSLYLSHTFTLSIMGKIWDKLWPHAGAPWLFTTAATAASVAAGVAAYLLLERPLLQWMRNGRAPFVAPQAQPART